jgi:hypothetical protein
VQQQAQFLRRAQLGQRGQPFDLAGLQAIANQAERRAVGRCLVFLGFGYSRGQGIGRIERRDDGPAAGFGGQVDGALALVVGMVLSLALGLTAGPLTSLFQAAATILGAGR